MSIYIYYSCFCYFTASIAMPNNENTLTYNPGQNIWNKREKSSKTGQVKKSLVIYFCVSLDCYCQSLVSGRETGHFPIISLFPQILSSFVY